MDVLNKLKPGQALTITHLSSLSGVHEDSMYDPLVKLEYFGLVKWKWINRTKVYLRA